MWYTRKNVQLVTTLLTHVNKCINQLSDLNLELKKSTNIHHYKTPRFDDFRLSQPRTNWDKQQILYQAASEWNSLSPDLKHSIDLKFFKSTLKEIF